MDTETYLTTGDLLSLVLFVAYIGLGVWAAIYGTKKGYSLVVGLLASWLLTPIGALVLFRFVPRN